MKLELKNISKKFKNELVLSNINLNLESGNIYGLYGRNGSGKSVLMKLIAGFYVPSNGEILYDNKNLNSEMKFPKDLRALIEYPAFFSDLTGYENLLLLAKIQNSIGEKEILKSLEIVNLLPEKDKKYGKYSLGMKQKLGIAQAIMEDSKILLLDEPFNGIEQETVDKIINYLQEIKKEKIIIISTHIMEDLEKLTDKILLLDSGILSEK